MKTILLKSGLKAMVDDQDYDELSKYSWGSTQKRNTTYCERGREGKCVFMHREILGKIAKRNVVDHIDGNGLNNQRSNLRICSHRENIRNSKLSSKNTTGFKGVYFRKDEGKYMAYIRHDYKMYNLGLFKTAKEAAIVRNKKALELHGEFAYINKIT